MDATVQTFHGSPGGPTMKTALPPSRRLLLALAVLLVLAAGLLSMPLRTEAATTRSGHEFIYFNDAAHDTVVGVQVWCKSGAHSGWGKITPYVEIDPSFC
jgi:hypothetical protein